TRSSPCSRRRSSRASSTSCSTAWRRSARPRATPRSCSAPSRGRCEEDRHHHVRHPRRCDAGAGRPRGGPHGRLRRGRLVVRLLGRRHGRLHDRADGPPVRAAARSQDVRHLRRALAECEGRRGCRAAVQSHAQARRVPSSQGARVGELDAHHRGRRAADPPAQGAGRPRSLGARQRRADPDAARRRSRRHDVRVDVPGHHRRRQAALRRRHAAGRMEAGRRQDRLDRRADRLLRARGRHQEGIVRRMSLVEDTQKMRAMSGANPPANPGPATRVLPAWAEELRRRYLRGEASMFLLHGNVYDVVVHDGTMVALSDFLANALLRDSKQTIVLYNLATGVRFAKRAPDVGFPDDARAPGDKAKSLAAIETMLTNETRCAVVLEYAEALVPAGDPSFQTAADRSAAVMLHRWSFLPAIEGGDNVVILVAENLTDVSPKLVSNPKVAVVEVAMPDRAARRAAAMLADPRLQASDVDRYADITAGLKALQIAAILAPPPPAEEQLADREAFLVKVLGGGPDAASRAHKLAALTAGLSRDEVLDLLAPGQQAPVD